MRRILIALLILAMPVAAGIYLAAPAPASAAPRVSPFATAFLVIVDGKVELCSVAAVNKVGQIIEIRCSAVPAR